MARWLRSGIAWVGIVAICLSVGRGCYNALRDSGDFSMRWACARLMLDGENPYEMKLRGDFSDNAVKLLEHPRVSFDPDYFPSALFPIFLLSLLRFELAALVWLLINLLASLVMIWAGHWYYKTLEGESAYPVAVAACLMLCGTPVRNTLGMGQLTLVSMAALTLSVILCRKGHSFASGVLLAVSWIKYTLAWPYVVFFFMFRGGARRPLFWAAAIHLALHAWICTSISAHPIGLVTDVLKCNVDLLQRHDLTNVWSLAAHIHRAQPDIPEQPVGLTLLFALVAFVAYLWRTTGQLRSDLPWFGILGILAILSAPNKDYNNVFLFFPCLWLMIVPEHIVARSVAGLTIGYFLFGQRILALTGDLLPSLVELKYALDAGCFVILIGVLAAIVRHRAASTETRWGTRRGGEQGAERDAQPEDRHQPLRQRYHSAG